MEPVADDRLPYRLLFSHKLADPVTNLIIKVDISFISLFVPLHQSIHVVFALRMKRYHLAWVSRP